jgi:hypothetical protein
VFCRFSHIDRRFGRFDLAEEEAPVAIFVAPVLEQLTAGGGDVWVVLDPPALDRLSYLVDDFVGLLPDGPVVERELAGFLLGLGDRNEELGWASAVRDLPRRLVVCTKDKMARRLGKRRIDDRVLDRAPLGRTNAFARTDLLNRRARALPSRRPATRF